MPNDPFKKKNTVNFVKGNVTKDTYDIKASTLEEVHAVIQKKGPRVKGKRYAGATDCIPAGFDEGYEVHVDEVDGKFNAIARFDKASLHARFNMILPKFESVKLDDPDEAKTWKSFYAEVIEHEYEHIADFEEDLNDASDEISKMTGEGSSKKRKQAEQRAKLNLQKEYKAVFGGKKIKDRIEARANTLDDATGHGPVLHFTVSAG